jgi:hypothetical protein
VRWAECAQQVVGENTNTFTFLNAWALAMALHLNPAFRVSQSPDFFMQAQRLFDLALQHLLDWKLLLKFLRCKRYVLTANEPDPKGKPEAKRKARRGSGIQFADGEEGIDALPPLNRRFDLRVRGFDALLAQQRAQDRATPGLRSEAQIEQSKAATTIHPHSGLAILSRTTILMGSWMKSSSPWSNMAAGD